MWSSYQRCLIPSSNQLKREPLFPFPETIETQFQLIAYFFWHPPPWCTGTENTAGPPALSIAFLLVWVPKLELPYSSPGRSICCHTPLERQSVASLASALLAPSQGAGEGLPASSTQPVPCEPQHTGTGSPIPAPCGFCSPNLPSSLFIDWPVPGLLLVSQGPPTMRTVPAQQLV